MYATCVRSPGASRYVCPGSTSAIATRTLVPSSDGPRMLRMCPPTPAVLVLKEFESDQASYAERERTRGDHARAGAERKGREASVEDAARKRDAVSAPPGVKPAACPATVEQPSHRSSANESEVGLLTFAKRVREKEAHALLGSMSSRITAPLRSILELIKWITTRRGGLLELMGWVATGQFRRLSQERLIDDDEKLIAASGVFDGQWYLETYADVAQSGAEPLSHYCRRGAAEGRDPNPLFDSDWYIARYPDVSGRNPLAHYLRFGAVEGRDPHPDFDTKFYLGRYRGVAEAGVNPLVHYVRFGKAEGRSTLPVRGASGARRGSSRRMPSR